MVVVAVEEAGTQPAEVEAGVGPIAVPSSASRQAPITPLLSLRLMWAPWEAGVLPPPAHSSNLQQSQPCVLHLGARVVQEPPQAARMVQAGLAHPLAVTPTTLRLSVGMAQPATSPLA